MGKSVTKETRPSDRVRLLRYGRHNDNKAVPTPMPATFAILERLWSVILQDSRADFQSVKD